MDVHSRYCTSVKSDPGSGPGLLEEKQFVRLNSIGPVNSNSRRDRCLFKPCLKIHNYHNILFVAEK